MATIVQKYGGTSVAGPDEIKRVAGRIVRTAEAGNGVCVVVSAMGHTTDELIELAGKVSADPHPRELDMLLTAGERISMALVSMAINDLGHEAVSFTGSQAGIVTDTRHGKARIVEMRRGRVHEALDEGKIAIVAGFQGVSTSSDVTTLGRGGSDTTAVALAAALEADVVRDLHRRRRRLQRRPANRPGRAQAAPGLVRGDARARRERCARARATRGRVRS